MNNNLKSTDQIVKDHLANQQNLGGTIVWYSDSEEFLQGVETGIEHTGDSAIETDGVVPSDNPKYAFMLIEFDDEAKENTHKFFDGSSFSHSDVIE